MPRPDLTVVVVTYDSEPFILDCLGSLRAQQGLSLEVFVVDNASHDDSVALVREHYPQVRLIANQDNRGFSAANNQALRVSTGRQIMLLNPDTYLFPDCLARMLARLEADPAIGAVGARAWVDKQRTLEICLEKPPTPFQALAQFSMWGRLLPKRTWLTPLWELDWDYFEHREPFPSITGMAGAFYMARREAVERLGWLDERFFLGYEDTDWSYSLRKAGYRLEIVAEAELVHYYGQSKRRHLLHTDAVFSWENAPLAFLDKHYPAWQVAAFRAGMQLGQAVKRGKVLARGLGVALGEPPLPAETRPGQFREAPQDITVSWRPSPTGRSILEISNTPRFIDKYGVVTEERSFTFPAEVLARLFPGYYAWRVVPAGVRTHREVLGEGRIAVV